MLVQCQTKVCAIRYALFTTEDGLSRNHKFQVVALHLAPNAVQQSESRKICTSFASRCLYNYSVDVLHSHTGKRFSQLRSQMFSIRLSIERINLEIPFDHLFSSRVAEVHSPSCLPHASASTAKTASLLHRVTGTISTSFVCPTNLRPLPSSFHPPFFILPTFLNNTLLSTHPKSLVPAIPKMMKTRAVLLAIAAATAAAAGLDGIDG